MPLADHGGFDLVVEIPEATALSIARELPFGSTAKPFSNTSLDGTVMVVAMVSAVTLTAPDRLILDIDLSGTRIVVSKVKTLGSSMNVAPWMQLIEPKCSLRINAPLTMTPTHSLVVAFSPSGNDPILTTTLDEDSILSSPLVTAILAQEILKDPANGTLYQQAKATIMGQFQSALEAQVRQSVTQLGVVALAPAPTAPFAFAPALPSSSSGVLNLIARSAFVILPRSIKLCYEARPGRGGSGGSAAAITVSNLVRSMATGTPVDAMAICISNAFVLRGLVLDGLTVPPPLGLGIPMQAFQPSHPLLMLSPLLTAVPGGPIPGIVSLTYNSIFGGIDGTNIRLLINMTANGVRGAFSISTAIDVAFSVTSGPGTPPSLVVSLAGPPTVRTDLSIAWWVYLGALTLPGLGRAETIASILAAADMFAGSLVNGPISTMLAGLAGGLGGPISMPTGPVPLSVRPPVSLGQSNAIRRTVTATIPGSSLTVPIVDPFLDNDILITLV